MALAAVVAALPAASVGAQAELPPIRQAIAAARSGDLAGFSLAASQIADPVARRLATWVLVDAQGEQLPFPEIEAARKDLDGWPRARRRRELAERAITGAGLAPEEVVRWFGAGPPATPEGAMVLAGALQASGRTAEARTLIRGFWRERLFDAGPQAAMLAAYGAFLDGDDHRRRLDVLLYGPHGPAVQALLPLVPEEQRALAEARIALRADKPDAMALAAALPAAVAQDPGLALEEARWLRAHNRMEEGFALLPRFPASAPHDDGQARLYGESRQYFVEALQRGRYEDAYRVLAERRFPRGTRQAEAEFFAGWIALTRLKDPARAAHHFEAVRSAGPSPLTQARALYWLGRTAEARGRRDQALAYYRDGARYVFAFYGQLCAEKAGVTVLTLPSEPQPSAADRAAFDAKALTRAARLLQALGETDLFKVFVAQLGSDAVRSQDVALAMDLARDGGEPFAAMTLGRAAASRGLYLPERMYPLLQRPEVAGAPEDAFTLAIIRQESSFDPRARTASARGLMMLRPETARILARRLGLDYEESDLWAPDYNLRLGETYLGQMVSDLGGSYLLAAAAYNAGPNRIPRWTTLCGDPRAGADPVDFIECTPFGETRDYMMRVMENLQVYRARLAGGSGPLQLQADLRRAVAADPR